MDSEKSALWGIFSDVSQKGRPDPVKKKQFKPKFDLPILNNYKDNPGKDFWDKFPSNYKFPGKSMINHKILRSLLIDNNITPDETVLKDLEFGASIGCTGDARLPSYSSNSKSALEFGHQVTDAIADWICKKLAFGPISKEKVPKNAKISGIMCRQKPNGSARVILNLSAPKGSSVNDGINSDDFPTVMSSTEKWLKVLNKAGHRCQIVKIDWSDAYKHIAVCPEDIELQFFFWLGMYFAELCLIFGASSSAGIYDRLAKLILSLVLAISKFPKDMVCQHLDDVVAAAPEDCSSIYNFDKTYTDVADKIGVKLAPRDDPDKAFAPRSEGIVLGIHYDTISWKWKIPTEKLNNMLLLIYDILENDIVDGDLIESLSGKLIHIKALIPECRFHISELMKAVREVRAGSQKIKINEKLRQQLDYWRLMLPVCNGNMNIPNPDLPFPVWALDFYTDAAGGTDISPWRGLGMVFSQGWSYLPWPRNVNFGKRDHNGRQLGKKLSFLELLGPLLVLCCAPDICRGNTIKVWIDNIGGVKIWQKGYSPTCELCTSVVRAIAFIASHLQCRIDIVKITRCSNRHALMADCLSKGDMKGFVSIWGEGLPDSQLIPQGLIKWINNPRTNFELGTMLCKEIDNRMKL